MNPLLNLKPIAGGLLARWAERPAGQAVQPPEDRVEGGKTGRQAAEPEPQHCSPSACDARPDRQVLRGAGSRRYPDVE